MTDTSSIRRRPDGSIDSGFYIAKGRVHRSKTAHHTAKEASRQSGKALVVLATLGLSTLFRGGQT